jgi:uncharacterized membrane protein (UPF0127 family)
VVLGLLVVAVVGVNALRDDDAPGDPDRSGRTASSDGPDSTDEPDRAGSGGRTPVPGYGFGEVALVVVEPDGTQHVLCVMTAEEAEQRARGLMEVTDESLGGYDGMLFLFPVDSSGGFWMRNTPMPLSIAYLAADGEIVSTADMEPCEDSPDCPSYPADGPYRTALEVPQGRLDDLGVVAGATVRQEGDCPAASG